MLSKSKNKNVYIDEQTYVNVGFEIPNFKLENSDSGDAENIINKLNKSNKINHERKN